MREPEQWTIAERYMVRYHLAHLMRVAVGALTAVLVMVGVAGIMLAMGVIVFSSAPDMLMYAVLAVTVVLAFASVLIREAMARNITKDGPLYQIVVAYKRATLAAYLISAVAGMVPVVVTLWSGTFGYGMLGVIAPLGVMAYHLPHEYRFNVFIELLIHDYPVHEHAA